MVTNFSSRYSFGLYLFVLVELFPSCTVKFRFLWTFEYPSKSLNVERIHMV
jgi:hypothetical protein